MFNDLDEEHANDPKFKYQQFLLGNMIGAEFIFVTDVSCSMSGKPLQSAKEALKIFIKSIPNGSKFNIIT